MISVNDPVSTLVRLTDGRVISIIGKPTRNIVEIVIVAAILIGFVIYIGQVNQRDNY